MRLRSLFMVPSCNEKNPKHDKHAIHTWTHNAFSLAYLLKQSIRGALLVVHDNRTTCLVCGSLDSFGHLSGDTTSQSIEHPSMLTGKHTLGLDLRGSCAWRVAGTTSGLNSRARRWISRYLESFLFGKNNSQKCS